ncbi:hypothetical protein GIB67_026528, partial [Kingdonia uniflora]
MDMAVVLHKDKEGDTSNSNVMNEVNTLNNATQVNEINSQYLNTDAHANGDTA